MTSKKRTSRTQFFIKRLLILIGAGLGGGLLIALIGYAYFSYNLPSIDLLSVQKISESTKIFDRTGTVILYDIHGEEKRTVINFEDIPQSLIDATLAAEDVNFYSHQGISIRGIIRAVYVDLIAGEAVQGGSTITQQLIKNTLLTKEKSPTRKIKEWILAYRLENTYSKDQILAAYLNQISYGANAYGIEAASQTFFGIPARELNLAQSALIAGIPKAPSYYSPYGSHKKELLARKDGILDRMEDIGFITPQEHQEAKKFELVFKASRETIKAPHFVMYVREYLSDRYGEDIIEHAGLRVITSLDYDLQQLAEKTVKEAAETNSKKYNATNAALVAMDPKTGQVLAMVGSKDYFDIEAEGNFNVTTAPRQPGSSFKPFAYAEAFRKGFTPDTILFDLPTEFNPNCEPGTVQENEPVNQGARCYSPENYTKRYLGPVSMRSGLAQSLNVPSVKTLYLAGVTDTIKLAERMGISTLKDRSRFGLALVLGGAEVKLVEMVNAYSVFADEGKKHPIISIMRIEDRAGNVLEEFTPQTQIVIEPQVARLVTSVLSDNNARAPMFGLNSALQVPGYSVAAKTGTTQDYHDGWLVGYSPTLTVGFWSGNNNNDAMTDRSPSGVVSGPWWNKFMKEALPRFPNESFNPPAPDLVLDKPMLNGNFIAETTYRIDKTSGKLATELTPPEFIEERRAQEVHSILYWVDKNNPRGSAPLDPNSDPQFKNWERSVQNWIQDPKRREEGIVLIQDSISQDTDDTHTEANRPRVTVLSPASETHISKNRVLEVRLSIQARFPLKQADYFVDGSIVGSKFSNMESYALPVSVLSSGNHTLVIKVYDDHLNMGEARVNFIVE